MMFTLTSAFLITVAFLIQDITIIESVSISKRTVYQTFFDNNLFLTCYGTCSQSANGFSSATRNLRCEGTKVRLKCASGLVIKVSFAFYGELEAGQEVCRDVSSLFEQCRKDVSEIVGQDCNGKGLCLFAVDMQRFGKLCQGQYFYLDVRHSCEIRPSTNKKAEVSTTTKGETTKQIETTQKTTKIKPITKYEDGSTSSSASTTEMETKESTTQGSTGSKDSASSTSTKDSTSQSSSSAVTTHVPIRGFGGSANKTRGGSGIIVSKLVTSLPTKLAHSSGKKASLYWLLTAHSLITDKGFIKANSTHLVLAIILSIFIALVISICFILDHSRRQSRRESSKQLKDECDGTEDATPMENGSPAGYDLNEEQRRPKSRSCGNPLIANGSAKRFSAHSLNEVNHNTDVGSEIFPLLPVRTGREDVNHEETKDAKHSCRSSIVDNLPPPPEELLQESPRQDTGGYLDDNESETSTVSIPPPVGFTDADILERSNAVTSPELQIKSPPLEYCSVPQRYSSLPISCKSLRSLPKIDNSKWLNNSFYPEMSTTLHDNNLLHNSVSVQTTDLRENSDRKSRTENAGHVSMQSPCSEISDIYAKIDTTSSIAAVDLLNMADLYHRTRMPTTNGTDDHFDSEKIIRTAEKRHSGVKTFDAQNDTFKILASKIEADENAKKGKLMVIKSSSQKSTEAESSRVKFDIEQSMSSLLATHDAEQKARILPEVPSMILSKERYNFESSPINASFSNGSIKAKDGSNKPWGDLNARANEKEEHMACASSIESDSSILPRYDPVSKQIFAVPNHRCGMGHSHKCVCVPLRTGNSSFICSCLENAKNKSLKCCMENCPDQPKSAGLPYSSQRSSNWRRIATDLPRRKSYVNRSIKRPSSLENIDQLSDRVMDVRMPCKKDEDIVITTDRTERSSRINDSRSKTLPYLQSKLKKSNVSSSGSRTLERVRWDSNHSPLKDPKLIPVIVHTPHNKQSPRFEKRKDKLEDKGKSVANEDMFRSNRSEDSDSSERSGPSEGRPSTILTTPKEKRRKKNGHHRLSPISENTSKKPSMQEYKSWPKRSPRFSMQVVESIHYDKKKLANEV